MAENRAWNDELLYNDLKNPCHHFQEVDDSNKSPNRHFEILTEGVFTVVTQ